MGTAFLPETVLGGSTVQLDAHSGPAGESPTGTASISLRQNLLGGPVTCLTVTGNRAIIGIDQVGGGLFGAFFVVEDNAASGAPDRFATVDSPGGPPTTCPADLAVTLQPVASGDLIVHAAANVPTSKQQCKNSGWRNFPGFKSQGACVSFVATGGRNPASGS